MRSTSCVLLLLALASCGESKSRHDESQAELRALVTDSVEQWDRRIRASCACLVAAGTYDSDAECLHWLASGPDWVECGTRALEGQVSPEMRAAIECELDFERTRADCYEAASCDAVLPCDQVERSCPEHDNALQVLILNACPDTQLLGRLDAGPQ